VLTVCAHRSWSISRKRRYSSTALPTDHLLSEKFIQGDDGDAKVLFEAMEGCDAVIHLAYKLPDALKNWEELLYENTENTRQVFKMASYLKIDRIIYASSNRTLDWYEIEHTPNLHKQGHSYMVSPNDIQLVNKADGVHLPRHLGWRRGVFFVDRLDEKRLLSTV